MGVDPDDGPKLFICHDATSSSETSSNRVARVVRPGNTVGAGRQPDGLIMDKTTPKGVSQKLSHTRLKA